MVLSEGGSFAYFARNASCTVATDFSLGAAIFSIHTLASPRGRNVNYDGKQLIGEKIFEVFLLSVQVS
jgi:hypothetical protein